jgi:hypothetical protein
MNREERIRSLDLDGEWFDCHDIQGYLGHHGLALDGSALRLEVPAAMVGHLYGFLPDRSVSSLYSSPEEVSTDRATPLSGPSSYMLDLECFFDRESTISMIEFLSIHTHVLSVLLTNLRILGRAPGFRVWDVDAALRSAIYRRPFG